MKRLLLLVLMAGTLNFMACNSKSSEEGSSVTDISTEDIKNTAIDEAETTTTMIDSTAVITSDTSTHQ